MSEVPPVSLALTKLGIPHSVFRHPGQVKSLEQAARERGQSQEQVVRSILFRLGEGEFLMALIAGPAQVSWKRLRQHVGHSRMTMATESEVMEVTGYRIGTVSPFGVTRDLRVLVDSGVLRQKEISIGSGMPNVGVILSSDDLIRALAGPEIVELTDLP